MPQVLKPIFPAVVEELERSHAEVDRVYQLEGDLVALEAGGEPSAGLRVLDPRSLPGLGTLHFQSHSDRLARVG